MSPGLKYVKSLVTLRAFQGGTGAIPQQVKE